MNIKAVVTEADLHDVFPVLQQLRTKLSREEASSLFQKMKEENYKLFSLRNEDEEVVSLAGVAICTNFYNEKHVFVYDLVTAEAHRSKGYGNVLLSYVEKWGKKKVVVLSYLHLRFQELMHIVFMKERALIR